jgi:hypothetical protein
MRHLKALCTATRRRKWFEISGNLDGTTKGRRKGQNSGKEIISKGKREIFTEGGIPQPSLCC